MSQNSSRGNAGTGRKSASKRKPGGADRPELLIERVQTGIRIEKRLLKVLKGLAEYHDLSLGDLLEGMVLHAFEGKAPFGRESLLRIVELKKIYGVDYDSTASHRLKEQGKRA